MLCTKIAKLDWNARPWLAGSPRLTMCASWCKHIHSHSLVQRRWLSFLSTTTMFGSPLDITVAELAIESFYPLDRHTAVAMRALAPAGR